MQITNLHSLPLTPIYVPYVYLPSLLPSNIPTCIIPTYQPVYTIISILDITIFETNKTNLPPLSEQPSTFPTCIQLPYLHIPSLLASTITSCIKPSYQPVYTNITPLFILHNSLLNLPVRPIYHPYLHLPSLLRSNIHIHHHTHPSHPPHAHSAYYRE